MMEERTPVPQQPSLLLGSDIDTETVSTAAAVPMAMEGKAFSNASDLTQNLLDLDTMVAHSPLSSVTSSNPRPHMRDETKAVESTRGQSRAMPIFPDAIASLHRSTAMGAPNIVGKNPRHSSSVPNLPVGVPHFDAQPPAAAGAVTAVYGPHQIPIYHHPLPAVDTIGGPPLYPDPRDKTGYRDMVDDPYTRSPYYDDRSPIHNRYGGGGDRRPMIGPDYERDRYRRDPYYYRRDRDRDHDYPPPEYFYGPRYDPRAYYRDQDRARHRHREDMHRDRDRDREDRRRRDRDRDRDRDRTERGRDHDRDGNRNRDVNAYHSPMEDDYSPRQVRFADEERQATYRDRVDDSDGYWPADEHSPIRRYNGVPNGQPNGTRNGTHRHYRDRGMRSDGRYIDDDRNGRMDGGRDMPRRGDKSRREDPRYVSDRSGRAPPNNRYNPRSRRLERRPQTALTTLCDCFGHCDVENLFEWVELCVMAEFLGFMILWWMRGNEDWVFELVLSIFFVVLSGIIFNMRRSHASMRFHEIMTAFNDFRIILFVVGLLCQCVSDIVLYDNGRKMFVVHTLVWFIGGVCFLSIDFGTYLSYFGRIAYPIVILTAVGIELVHSVHRFSTSKNDKILSVNGRHYTVLDLKIDGLSLMGITTLCTLVYILIDRRRVYHVFGTSSIARRGYLGLAPMHLKIEDSLMLLWTLNLCCMLYLSFFTWDPDSPWKILAAVLMIGAIAWLTFREADLSILLRMATQLHSVFLFVAALSMWIMNLILVIGYHNKSWRWLLSVLVNTVTVTAALFLILLPDSLALSSSSFLIRGTLPLIFTVISAYYAWYATFFDVRIVSASPHFAIIVRLIYYIFMAMAIVSLLAWMRDPPHTYFIFIQHRRKRDMGLTSAAMEHFRDDNANQPRIGAPKQVGTLPTSSAAKNLGTVPDNY